METYLYFRKFRPADIEFTQGSATNVLAAITGIGGAANEAEYKIGSATEIASITVTAADAANTAIGSNYTAIANIGDQTTVAVSAIRTVADSVVTLDTSAQDSDNGYTLEVNDKVKLTFQQGLETCVMYPATSLMGIEATATGKTTLRFMSLKNNNQDDFILINHDNGKYGDIVAGLNAIVNGKNHGGIVTVVDGSGGAPVINDSLKGLGIDGLGIELEDSY
tara:strand:- start:4 stop:669 length:666 start_codon:yes stop_codon:yes gene_type:complete